MLRAENLATLMCRLSRNSRSLNLLDPYGAYPDLLRGRIASENLVHPGIIVTVKCTVTDMTN
jgi:hypothetical protein